MSEAERSTTISGPYWAVDGKPKCYGGHLKDYKKALKGTVFSLPTARPISARESRNRSSQTSSTVTAKLTASPLASNERGLVISAPIVFRDEGLFLKSAALDPQELRFALLFWDRLEFPSSNIFNIAGDTAEEQFLA